MLTTLSSNAPVKHKLYCYLQGSFVHFVIHTAVNDVVQSNSILYLCDLNAFYEGGIIYFGGCICGVECLCRGAGGLLYYEGYTI